LTDLEVVELDSGNIFVWVWTIAQWNLMARSKSIDPLALHNMSVSEDHFGVKHDSTKTDKKGVKLHTKNVFCNPLNPIVCFGVSMGVRLCLEQDSFEDSKKDIPSWRRKSGICRSSSILPTTFTIYQEPFCTRIAEGECHSCVKRNDGSTSNCLDCEPWRLG
jgi:hypothetical protein